MISEAAIQEAQDAFGKMVSRQMVRITGELKRLDEVLKAGRVDTRILSDFRGAVEHVRTCGWHVQVWLEGDERALTALLMEERVSLAIRMAQNLASEMGTAELPAPSTAALKEAVRKLDEVLEAFP
ncbi:MAG TPA: hypothetical protein VIX19_06820 [Terriglobales bacterium]